MGGGDVPTPPNPAQTARAQTGANVGSAIASGLMNDTNQVTPQGNLTYSQNGTQAVTILGKTYQVPTMTATQSYSPAEQALFDAQNAVKSNISNVAQTESGQLGSLLGTPYPTFDGSNQAVQNQLFSEYSPYETHIQQVGNDALDSKLAAQGVTQGSAAYTNAQRDNATQNQDAWNSLLMGGQQQAYQELQGNYATALTQRQEPINELNALISSSQVTNPTFGQTPTTNIAPANYEGDVNSAYQGQLQAYQIQQQQQNAMMGGLFGLAGSIGGGFAMHSDRRLKTTIQRIGSLVNGLPLYLFRYLSGGDPQVGLMADEVLKVRPEAVSVDPNGYYMVDYRLAVQ